MTQTIIDVLEQRGSFNSLVNAIKLANLDQTLQETGPFTLFAPTDDAIAAMPDRRLDKWRNNVPKLTKVLKFHCVGGRFGASDLLERNFIKTLEGERLHITSQLDNVGFAEAEATDAYGYVVGGTITVAVAQTLKVNGAAIVQANLAAENGLVHGIDHVLVPWLLDLVR